ncbi:AAA family ATPase [Paenarthrobacter nicotinovorans]|uniref:AAA family ATPase n=1 Tax=Paenarthrobacter nicotinovorans TaxID=29320 RepID=UPI0037F682C1
MSKVVEFEISGLAGRPGVQKARLSDELNVFWGLNGSGKTSMLKILDSALGNDTTALRGVAFHRARITIYDEAAGALFERSIDNDRRLKENLVESVHVDDSTRETFRFIESAPVQWTTKLLQGDSGQPVDLNFEHSFLSVGRLNDVQPRQWGRAGFPVDYEEFDFEDDIENAWRRYNSESLSRIKEIQQKGLADILSVLFQDAATHTNYDIPSLSDVSDAYTLVLDFLIGQGVNLEIDRDGFIAKYRRQPELQSVVRRIRRVNEEIEFATHSQRAFQGVIGSLYSGDKRILFNRNSRIEFHFGRKRLGLNHLSSGEKQLLRILLTTLSSGSGAVLVDEPELSMHVDWQRRLLKSMQDVNPKCQLILATHSPEVVATVPARHIFEL